MICSSDILKASILIVDDQEANVSLLEQMLRGAGYESISSTRNPHEVCELHRKNRYSLILLDLQMPGMDGFQVMEGLKAIESGGYLPVLVQTSQPGHRLRALKAGAKDFVSKPFDLAEVLLRVHNMLEVRLLHREAENRTEQAEARSQQSESANLAKGQFLANMSHELRTPLNAIIGFSEVLADKTFGDLNDRQLKYINNVLNSGRHLLQLINDILDLAKVETGRVELMRNTFSVAKALQEVHAIVKTLANKKRISLEFEVEAHLPTLFADEAKFKQIMYNMLSNAIKFTPDGGKVLVTAGIESATGTDSSPAGDSLRITVADTGIGINAKDHERVFKEFEQVDSSYGRRQQGTGLGLALTKRLVEMHGGRIWVQSEGVEGKGSTFMFVIPIRRTEPNPMRPNDTPHFRNETIRPLVLVVTSDDSHQRLLAHYLSDVGFDIAVVSETLGMIAALKARRPYAVVMDRNLGRSGVSQDTPDPSPEQFQSEFSDALTQHEYRSHIPAGIPQVIFSQDGEDGLTFRLLGKKGAVSERVSSRLVDAIRQSDKTMGKELKIVLVIDDELAILELLTLTLIQKGFSVLRTSDGRIGVELATHYLPEMVILDLNMPGLDGTQVVEQLRAHPRTKTIPILINTGTVLNEEERQRLAGHVQSITYKTERENLLTELERLVRSSDEMTQTTVGL